MNATQTMTTSPILANAIERILALAAHAAMQGRTDFDLLSALNQINAEVRTADMEYFGGGDEPIATESDHNDNDIPY